MRGSAKHARAICAESVRLWAETKEHRGKIYPPLLTLWQSMHNALADYANDFDALERERADLEAERRKLKRNVERVKQLAERMSAAAEGQCVLDEEDDDED